MNLLQNGGFDGNLDRWAGTGTIDRTLGYPRLGCVVLAAGQAIESDAVGFSENALYTLHYFYRLATGATLTVTIGSITQQRTGTPLDVWREGVMPFALDASLTDGVEFSCIGGTAYIDTITLLSGGLVIDRATLANMIAARLGTLATDASLSSGASAAGPNGDYSIAIDDALRAVGAMNAYGDPDVTLLIAAQIDDVVVTARNTMLQSIQATYALKSDVSLGPRRESFSQVAGNIGSLMGGAGGKGGGGRVSVGKLTHQEWPR